MGPKKPCFFRSHLKTIFDVGCWILLSALFSGELVLPRTVHARTVAGGEKTLQAAAEVEKEIHRLKVERLGLKRKLQELEKTIADRGSGWRRAAVKANRVSRKIKAIAPQIEKKRKKSRRLRARGIRQLKHTLSAQKTTAQIRRSLVAHLLYGRALLQNGKLLLAARVFHKVQKAGLGKKVTDQALEYRIIALDRRVKKMQLPAAPQPHKKNTKVVRKPLPKNIVAYHRALMNYVARHPKSRHAAIYAYWMGTHNYLYGRLKEAKKHLWWVITHHCRSKTALESGRVILQAVILQKGKKYLKRLHKTVNRLRRIRCWRRRTCKKGDVSCKAWAKAAGRWMLELGAVEDRIEKQLRLKRLSK